MSNPEPARLAAQGGSAEPETVAQAWNRQHPTDRMDEPATAPAAAAPNGNASQSAGQRPVRPVLLGLGVTTALVLIVLGGLYIGGAFGSPSGASSDAARTEAAQSTPSAAATSSGPCNGSPCIGKWPNASEARRRTTTRPASAPGPGFGVQSLPVQCGFGVASGSSTTCTFAENAFYEYWRAASGDPTRSETVMVWSPTDQRSYSLSCGSRDGVVDCRGTGNSGSRLDARFSQDAVSSYTSAQAAQYAASGKLGPPTSLRDAGRRRAQTP
jgi:hypothetical protein